MMETSLLWWKKDNDLVMTEVNKSAFTLMAFCLRHYKLSQVVTCSARRDEYSAWYSSQGYLGVLKTPQSPQESLPL